MYPKTNSNHNQDFHSIVEQYGELVKKIAAHLLARLPASVSKEDLIQAGMIGLMEASKRYDSGKGASFGTFASIRIKGAMLDEIRRGDWVPRSVHRNTRKISEAMRRVENRNQCEAMDSEIAEELGVSIDVYHDMLNDTQGSKLFNFSDLNQVDDDDSYLLEAAHTSDEIEPSKQIEMGHVQKCLAKSIESLPEREQLVLALYYQEELNLKQIGQILGVTESRVSQIHSQAAIRLRNHMRSWLDKNH